MCKTLVTISLIFILVLNTVINTLLFLSLQQEARNRIKKIVKGNFSERKIDTIRVSSEIFKNKKIFRFVKDDEFYYKQNLYDIKRVEENAGQVTIYCINDTYEASIIKNYLNSEKSENSNSPLGKVLKLLGKINFEFILIKNYSFFHKENCKFISTAINLYKSIILLKLDPPPRVNK